MEPASEADIADLRLLQEALRASPENLRRWVVCQVASELDACGLEEARYPEEEDGRVLMPVIETLPPAQRHRFREAIAKNTFYEIADEFYQSFVVRMRSVNITGVEDDRSA